MIALAWLTKYKLLVTVTCLTKHEQLATLNCLTKYKLIVTVGYFTKCKKFPNIIYHNFKINMFINAEQIIKPQFSNKNVLKSIVEVLLKEIVCAFYYSLYLI